VSIEVTSNQAKRILETFTKADGNFSTLFYPAPTEYGTYTAAARHPSSLQSMVHKPWKFLGLRAAPRLISLNGATVNAFENMFYNVTMVTNDPKLDHSGELTRMQKVQLRSR